jgi:hypothetical protein
MVELPQARSIEVNPSQERLRELTLERMPRVTVTEFGNLNYQAEVTSRLSNSTFFIADHEIHKNRIPRAEAEEWARLQDEHIASQDMLLIEGRVGPDPSLSTPSRLMIEAGGANSSSLLRLAESRSSLSSTPHRFQPRGSRMTASSSSTSRTG